MAKHNHNLIAHARKAFLAVIAVVATFMTFNATAQEEILTLTNGKLWYLNNDDAHSPAEDASRIYPGCFVWNETYNSWDVIHKPFDTDRGLSHITERGDYYMKLDLSDPAAPKLVAKSTSEGPDLYCFWLRTASYAGLYYQEWDGIKYYLVGSKNGLRVSIVPEGGAVEDATTWYAWDFGAAMIDVAYRSGAREEDYYWMSLDTTGADDDPADFKWVTSCNTYQRPDQVHFVNPVSNWETNWANRIYCCNKETGDPDNPNIPTVDGALFMPVKCIKYERHRVPQPGEGLTAVSITATDNPSDVKTSISFGDEFAIRTTINSGMPVQVVPYYEEYREEVKRRGINLKYGQRTTEGVFNSKGILDREDVYYWWEDNGEWKRHDVAPSSQSETLVVDSTEYILGRSAQRYLSINDAVSPATISCIDVSEPATVTLKVVVHYTNGLTDTGTVQITLSNVSPHRSFDDVSAGTRKGPIVRGYVVGGGRMAMVGTVRDGKTVEGTGNTNVVVSSCDTIYALYGGNDIAGWVQGTATVQIGTRRTSAEHPVRIGYVYGGGCGYYTYRGLTFGPTGYPYLPGSYTPGLRYQNYYFGSDVTGQECVGEVYPWNYKPTYRDGHVTTGDNAVDTGYLEWDRSQRVVDVDFTYLPTYLDPTMVDQGETGTGGNGTIPYVKTAHISVGIDPESVNGELTHGETMALNDNILIDSIFGGGENSFIGVDADGERMSTAVTVDIYGGTIYTVFGGNNYGGSTANKSTVYVNVHDTKLFPDKDVVDIVDGESVPRTPGIDTYFDGYGRVFGIRYLFGGGNLVDAAHAEVNITGGMIDTCYLGGNQANVISPIGTINCVGSDHFICTNPSYAGIVDIDPNDRVDSVAKNDSWGPYVWDGEVGSYNVRTIFGGNNKADMDLPAVIHLKSGGVSCIYGGGNMGNMTNEGGLTKPEFIAMMNRAMHMDDACTQPIRLPMPNGVGSIVFANNNSNIVADYVFGGSRMGNIRKSCGVYLAGGIFGYVNGGNDVSGDVGSETDGGTYVILDSNVVVVGDAVAGSDGFYHCETTAGVYDANPLYDTYTGEVYDTYDDFIGMLLPTHNSTNIAMKGGLVKGMLYGGGVHANVGFSDAATAPKIQRGLVKKVSECTPDNLNTTAIGGTMHGRIHFDLTGGHIMDKVFGGGYMSSTYGLTYLHVGGDIVIDGSLFAGNDLLGRTMSFGAYRNYAYDFVEADLENYAVVTASNGDELNRLEDGKYQSNYSSYLLVDGTPTINCVYGSGNGAYNYDGSRPEYESATICILGGQINRPRQNTTYLDINVEGGRIDTVFGGGNGVGVEENVVVLLNAQNNGGQYVGTIFGGNNRDNMEICVPDIILHQGVVQNVYGGGNAGNMNGSKEYTDVCGNLVSGVSTYIKIDNPNVTVQGDIYGGCRMADVKGMAYIDVRSSTPEGINSIYGGNDIAGTITGNTRIDVSGGKVHHIYGGSNGGYDYDRITNTDYMVYTFGSDHENDANLVAAHASGRPFVDSTTINLWGGSFYENVYGGGRMGDCRATYVMVNDAPTMEQCPNVGSLDLELTLVGSACVYGGGEGFYENLNLERVGNVLGRAGDDNTESATNVHLYHATNVGTAIAYGGGRGGDVFNTNITAYNTWNHPFTAIYGGCWGSDVKGSTHVNMQGAAEGKTASNVYGGNDFTGYVYKTNIRIEGGTYDNIFGGGNGDYVEGRYTGAAGGDWAVYSGTYSAQDAENGYTQGVSKRVYVPNNEYAEINFIDGTVNGNIYGGGNLGTTMRIGRNDDDSYRSQGGGASMMADTTRSLTTDENLPETDATNYSYIMVNVFGGNVENNIYAGAKGAAGQKQLVYGLKQVNMENGIVKDGVYGGSENVRDGYPWECRSKNTNLVHTNTTERPSSILNITGGTVKGHVYGGGYLGNVHGSVYVNVGVEAVNKSSVWGKTVNDEENAYAIFKPGDASGIAPALTANELQLQGSIYGGANWGSNVGSADFGKQGFFGGESRILVDGRDYNTYLDVAHSGLPLMNIVNSVIGSGTSAGGGDVYNRIDLRNYGAMNPSNCKPTTTLRSVQRADALWLYNTVIDYTGATDAISAYTSNIYTINRVDTLNCVGYNVVDVDATMTNIGEVDFYKEPTGWNHGRYSGLTLVDQTMPTLCFSNDVGGCIACDDDATVCEEVAYLHRPDEGGDVSDYAFTAFVLNNGINVDFISEDGQYAPIYGFAFIIAQNGTNAVITARSKYVTGDYEYGYGTHNANNMAELAQDVIDMATSGEQAKYSHYVDYTREVEYGGFLPTCADSLKAIIPGESHNTTIEWCDCILEDGTTVTDANYQNNCFSTDGLYKSVAEYPYHNYASQYRTWSIGQGLRRRFTVIQAHSVPDSLYKVVENDTVWYNKKITLLDTATAPDSLYNLAIATAKITLPPTVPGHYYKIDPNGVIISDENAEMRLTDVAYRPTGWDDLDDEWKLTGVNAKGYDVGTDAAKMEPAGHGVMEHLQLNGTGTLTGINKVYKSRSDQQYFGLLMASGANFDTTIGGNLVAPKTAPVGWTGSTTISGNAYTNMIANFSTAQVGSTVNASPELDLFMLYNNNFNHTLLGTVVFTLDEYVAVPKRTNDGAVVDGDLSTPEVDTVWLDSNLHTPIEVEVTISTILQNFADMEYEVLAMYNEGLADLFSRKVVLPATLQRREIYLQNVAWYPTDKSTGTGDTLHTASNPTYFYLTDDNTIIKNQTPLDHSYFGMSIKPVDNISNTIVTAVGWHSITATDSINLYDAVDKARVAAGQSTWNHAVQRVAKDYYYQDNENPAIKLDSVWVGTYEWSVEEGKYLPSGHGIPLGVLDGRGEAAINVTLNYDGDRIYEDIPGNGYIGKVVLSMASYTGGDYSHPNKFRIVINVKTRAKGDTIYLASDPNGFDIIGSDGTTHFHALPCTDYNDINAGKEPLQYVTSFYDAFTKVYEEGDVIAIIDTVIINSQELIKGNEYMPARIIRYDGHHHQLPGENCVYRGPMIVVDGANAAFTARCVDFVGSATAKISPEGPRLETPQAVEIPAYRNLYNPLEPSDVSKYADTNCAYAPVIVVKNNATVTMQNSTSVKQNWNGYHFDGVGEDDITRYGAINISGGGTLRLVNNVTISENLNDSIADPSGVAWRLHPYTGAVYLDGGTMELMESNKKTAVTIQSNYLYKNGACDTFWTRNTTTVNAQEKLVGWLFNGTEYNTDSTDHTKANVFLERKEAAAIPAAITALGADAIQAYKDTVDSQSAYIYFNHTIPENTSIGVTKWFPDRAEVLRDTIRIVYQPDATHLSEALYNENFTSDNGFNVFYSYNVANQYMFLQRCATFRYQMASLTPFYPGCADDPLTPDVDESREPSILPGDVLTYSPLLGITCPVGGDTLIYRVQGGFFPYTYTWTHIDGGDRVEDRSYTTPYTNIQINSQLAEYNYDGFRESVADTHYTSHITLTHRSNEQLLLYTVTANDATGNCPLTKNIWINMKKVDEDKPNSEKSPIDNETRDPLYYATAHDGDPATNYDAWLDADNMPGDTARVDRYFRAVKVTPKVWADRTMGTIDAIIPKDSVYEDVEGRPVLNNMLFCGGDIIRLVTVPRTVMVAEERVPVAEFIMWDFDPYYTNPATYVVPATSSQVVAYYGPAAGANQYWKDTIKTTTLANAAVDDNYYFSDRNGKSYVTTYHGDVHIYDEDGLAWFISVVNGLNGTQAREFFFNKVYIHKKSAANKYGDASAYHMENHLWTPVGTHQHPFRGWLYGVNNTSDSCTVPLDGDYVVIKNIIVNEPDMDYAGFFGHIDSARVRGIKLESALVRGSQYVGTLAADSRYSRIANCAVTDNIEDDAATTILTTHYVSGGVVGKSFRDTINVVMSKAKYVGDAVYSGGVVGYGSYDSITNSLGNVFSSNNRRMNGLYLGGIAGYLDGDAPVSAGLFRAKRAGDFSVVKNNYVRFVGNGNTDRVGGLVGYAKNTVIENNYVYGDIHSGSMSGAVTAVADNGTCAHHNYYENGTVKLAAGVTRSGATVDQTTAFSGSGNQVELATPSQGVSNMTRALNRWVRANGDDTYLSWRSDLERVNSGYPIFGEPDLIPVSATLAVHGCDSLVWNGQVYSDGDSIMVHVIDSVEMIDSTSTVFFYVGHSSREQYADTGSIGLPYSGYGFYLSPTETALLRQSLDAEGRVTITLTDTLASTSGCDSIVTVSVTFFGPTDIEEAVVEPTAAEINVYPNPTTSRVTVETQGLQHVELYDNDGRSLADYIATDDQHITFDVFHLSTGVYYLRIHTDNGVTIQKLIKK